MKKLTATLDFSEIAQKLYGWGEHKEMDAFTAGANHGYSLAMEQHRDFYLLVRSYFSATAYLSSNAKDTPERALRLQECQQYTKMILQRLEVFTSRELESLPFKD